MWRQIGPGIAVQQPLGELRAAFRRTDIVAVDLDQCIFPGYTQTALGARAAREILWRPRRAADRRLLPRLALGGLFFALKEAKRALGLGTPMRRLVARYERVARGLPEDTLAAAAATIPRDSHPWAAETLALLAQHAPTGIVSLGLDIVVRAYLRQFPFLDFFAANTVRFHPAPDRPGRLFAGYDHAALLENGQDKRRALQHRMAQRGAEVPTMIGHHADDLPLAELCRQRRGLAIAFNPAPRLAHAFHAVVRGRDWQRLYALVAILSPLSPTRASVSQPR